MRKGLEPHYFRRLGGLLATTLAIYVVFLAMLVLFQRQLMYFPDSHDFVPTDYGFTQFTRNEYTADDGVKLHAFYAPPSNPAKPVIVFFQGNAGNLGIRAEKIRMWLDWGFGAYLPTYRGYHGNAGSPTEQGLYSDARAALHALQDQFNINRKDIVLYGESLGTGIATQMAEEGDEKAVVLEVPYTSIPDIGSARYPFVPIFWLAWDRFESFNKIRFIKSPLLILKAAHDSVIPSILEQRLFDQALEPKQLVVNPTADHMEIYSDAHVVEQIHDFLDGIK